VRYTPDEADLVATERKINALWQAIDRARSSGDWRPRPSRLCSWCSHQAMCPAFGGTPPPLPADEPATVAEQALPEQALLGQARPEVPVPTPEAAVPGPSVPEAAVPAPAG
jgi:hypothetical protein